MAGVQKLLENKVATGQDRDRSLFLFLVPHLLLGSTSAFLQMRLEKRRPTPLMEVSEYCTCTVRNERDARTQYECGRRRRRQAGERCLVSACGPNKDTQSVHVYHIGANSHTPQREGRGRLLDPDVPNEHLFWQSFHYIFSPTAAVLYELSNKDDGGKDTTNRHGARRRLGRVYLFPPLINHLLHSRECTQETKVPRVMNTTERSASPMLNCMRFKVLFLSGEGQGAPKACH